MKKIMAVFALFLFVTVAFASRYSMDYRFRGQANGTSRKLFGASSAVTDDSVINRTDIPSDNAPALDSGLEVGDELTLSLFDDVETTLTIEEITPSPLGGKSMLASSTGYEGVRNAVVVQNDDGLQIDIQDYNERLVYTVFSSNGGVSVKKMRQPTLPQQSGRELLAPAPAGGDATDGPVDESPPVDSSVSASVITRSCVDILVVFDTLASAWADSNGGGAANFAEVTVQKLNTALSNTGLDDYFRFRLVGVKEVKGSGAIGYSNGETLDAILDSITDASIFNGYNWSTIKSYRDDVKADIVCVLTDTGCDSGTVGMGFSFVSGSASYFADYAFNVCAIRAVADGHTMTHEVGHNMGAGHSDMQTSSPGPQYYKYSSGYYFHVGSKGYGTIMSYNFDGHGNSYTIVPWFSSPDYQYNGVYVGDANHDNTLTLRKNFGMVSRFRGDDGSEQITRHTISFDANGGSSTPPSITRLEGDEYGTLPVVTRDGHAFDGWYTSLTGGMLIKSTAKVTASVTLYAHWTLTSTVADALDVVGMTFSNGGDASWFWQNSVTYDGVDAARSGRIESEQYSSISTTVFGPADVSFWWKVSSEESFDYMDFSIDGVSKASISGNGNGWSQKTFSVGSGSHTLEWKYTKDDSCDEGEDCGWVDQLTITYQESYTISFNANGGTSTPSSFTRAEGDEYGTLPVVSRSGYLFDGWFTSATGDERVADSDKVTSSITLYAHWTQAGTLAAALDVSGRTFTNGSKVKWFWQNSVTHDGVDAARSGQVGDGQSSSMRTSVSGAFDVSFWWNVSSEELYDQLEFVVDGRIMSSISGLGGLWRQETFSIGPGTHTLEWRYIKDESGSEGDDCGWVDQLVITPTGSPSDESDKVHFDSNGGSGTMKNVTYSGKSSVKLPLNAFTRRGYRFAGWSKISGGGVEYVNGQTVRDFASVIGGAITLYAVWKPNVCKIYFKANGGKGTMSAQSVKYGRSTALSANRFKRSHYHLTGWAKSSRGSVVYKNRQKVKNLSSKNGAKITLYAKWAKNYYYVTFNPNGGTGKIARMAFTGWSKYRALPKRGFTRKGYVLRGWATTRGGDTEFKLGEKVKMHGTKHGETMALYAVWSPAKYYVAFNANGGYGKMSRIKCTYAKARDLPANGFLRRGYRFVGWARSSRGTVAYGDGDSVKNLSSKNGATVTFYAVWTKSSKGLGAAIEASQYLWTTSDDPWTVITEPTYDGVDAVQSSGGGGGEVDTWMKTTVTGGAKKMSFYVQKRYYYATFSVQIDGKAVYSDRSFVFDSDSTWSHVSVSIPSGTHEVKFNYHHPGQGFAYEFNGVRIDNVKFTDR